MNGMNNSTSALSSVPARVSVAGIGDTGVRAASAMADSLRGLAKVTCIDTDSASLHRAGDGVGSILVGERSFHGFGSGGDIVTAERAAREQVASLVAAVSGAECVVIMAGMGGGAGSGVAPVVAAAAKLAGAQVICIVSMPFEFEGQRRDAIARDALAKLKAQSDAIIPLSNDRLIACGAANATMDEALRSGRRLCANLAQAIASLFSADRPFSQLTPGHLVSVLPSGALAFAGCGEGSGASAAADATEAALNSPSAVSPTSEVIDRAILLIESGPGLSLTQAAAAMGTAQARLGAAAELHLGIRESKNMGSDVKATLFAACRERRRPAVMVENPASRRTFDARTPVPMFR
jgi:cell division protein FtsZ